MWLYVLNVLLIIAYSFFIKNKKQYVMVVSFQLFLLLALRHNELGDDLLYYNSGFNFIKKLDFFSLVSRLHFFKTASLVYPFKYESGFVFLCWLISHLGFSFHFLLIVCAAINMYAFGKFIFKYSEIPWLSFAILCTFGTYIYFFGILRHSLSLSFFIFSLMCFLDNNKKKSIIFYIVSFLFHRSSLVLLPLLFVVNRECIKKKNAIILLIMSLPFIILSKYFYSAAYSIMKFFNQGGYIGHELKINTLIILLYFILIIVIIFVNFEKMKNNKIFNVCFWALILSLYFEIIGLYNDVMSRSVQMYISFLIILIPNVVKIYEKQKVMLIVKIIIVVSLLFYMVYYLTGNKIVPYRMQEKNIIFAFEDK